MKSTKFNDEPTTMEALTDYCRELVEATIPKRLRKKFMKIVFDYYDNEGPGLEEDIKSEIYVYDKASFAQEFFHNLGMRFFEVDSDDLYKTSKERSKGYNEAFQHTLKSFSMYGGPDALYA